MCKHWRQAVALLCWNFLPLNVWFNGFTSTPAWGNAVCRWWTRLWSVHNLARSFWVRMSYSKPFQLLKRHLAMYTCTSNSIRKNEVWESESGWPSLPRFSCVRPLSWGWMSVEAWYKDSKNFRDCQIRADHRKNLHSGNVKVFALYRCVCLPNRAKMRQASETQKFERFWDLEMPFFFVIFAEHLTQISVFMSRYNYEDTHGWTSLDTYMGRLLKRVLWMYVETGLSIKLPVYVLP